MPGTVLGPLTGPFRKIGSHLETTNVIAPACHDTGFRGRSGAGRRKQLPLSSGTWSLLGTEIAKPSTTKPLCNSTSPTREASTAPFDC